MFKGCFKKIVKIVAVICSVLFVAFLTGCAGCYNNEYSGKYSDLYTVAINSLLWNAGYSAGADRKLDSEIEMLEKDEYGRMLFTYYEGYFGGGTRSISSLIIAQNSFDGYVYYYEDLNFVIKPQDKYSHQKQNFSQEEIDNLKAANDWGKELDLGKCTKKKISRKKQAIPTDIATIKDEAVVNLNITGSKDNVCVYYLTNDSNDNFIVYGSVINSDYDLYFVAFVNSEGNVVDWLVPQDPFNYQDEFKIFKNQNGWLKN